MKALNILIIGVLVLFASCTKESEVIEIEEINFEGVYLGKFDCKGQLSSANGEEFQISITKAEEQDSYIIDFGDDVIFHGTADENQLVIPRQTINEEIGFDVVTLEGFVTFQEEDQFSLDIFHKVDDEDSSQCVIEMTKV